MAEPTLLELISGGKVRHGGTGKYKEEEGAIAPLTESKLVTDFVLPMVTGATAATEDYEPGALDVAFAIPVVGKAGRVGLNIGKKVAGRLFSKETLKSLSSIKPKVQAFVDNKMYKGNFLLPEKTLTQSQRALVKETREFTKENLTNEEGYKRYIRTFFDDAFIEPDEMELLEDYLMNSPRGKIYWKEFKQIVGENIDIMDYRNMVNPTTDFLRRAMGKGTVYGVHMPGSQQVAGKQKWFNWGDSDRLRKTTGQTNVHEFTHAGQLHRFQGKLIHGLKNIFDPNLNPDIFSASTKLQSAMAKAKGTTEAISGLVKQGGSRQIFGVFQHKLMRNMRPEAKELMKRQFSKKGGLLNYLRKTGKYSSEVRDKNYILYVNDWWETTARLNAMRYIEHLGLDVRKSSQYRELLSTYDEGFIKEIYKYSWAGIPLADAQLFGEPDEHLNRLEKIE